MRVALEATAKRHPAIDLSQDCTRIRRACPNLNNGIVEQPKVCVIKVAAWMDDQVRVSSMERYSASVFLSRSADYLVSIS